MSVLYHKAPAKVGAMSVIGLPVEFRSVRWCTTHHSTLDDNGDNEQYCHGAKVIKTCTFVDKLMQA